MPNLLLVWVTDDAGSNLDIALDRGVWGTPALQTAPVAAGDEVLFGNGVTRGPRQSEESWLGRSVRHLVHGRITSSWYESSEPIWPGPGTYPHRFDFEWLKPTYEDVSLLPDVNMTREMALQLRLAGVVKQNGGLQAQIGDTDGVLFLRTGITDAPAERLDSSKLAGDLDVATSSLARGEQSRLRKTLGLTSGTHALCDLCGWTLPTDFLVAAHIKQRSACSEQELRDLAHIAMRACKLGCDALYETGCVSVDIDGTIVVTSTPMGADLSARALELAGRRCTAFSPESAPYFLWHRKERFRA